MPMEHVRVANGMGYPGFGKLGPRSDVGARLEQADLHHQKAFSLNPNDPRIVAQRGELLTWQGHPDEGADWARLAMRLDPYDASGRVHLLGRALHVARLYLDAIEAFSQSSCASLRPPRGDRRMLRPT